MTSKLSRATSALKMVIATLLLIAGAFLAGASLAHAQQPTQPGAPLMGHDSGNGGGGVVRNGRYMTFYSAGFYTEPNEAVVDEVPQLSVLIEFLNSLTMLSELTKVKYVSALIPSSARKYYRVQSSTFTPEVRTRLIAEYGRVMQLPTEEVALFAITDISSKTTYILPEFYSLNPVEQMAVLYHETYWILNPNGGYQKVIQSEMAFQAYVEKQDSPERLLRWLDTAGTKGDAMVAAIQHDLKTKSLKKLLQQNRYLSLSKLLGDKYVDCKLRDYKSTCESFFLTNVYELSKENPNSLFLKMIFEHLSLKKISVCSDRWGSDYCFSRSSYLTDEGDADDIEVLKPGVIDLMQTNFDGSAGLQISGTSKKRYAFKFYFLP